MQLPEKAPLRFLTCGSVDDGKSTLIGHLLYLTGNLYDDQVKTLEAESRKIGNAGDRLDFSLLMDGLLAEREQGITIDVAYRYFHTPARTFIVADTPGHEQYTRNMATAASTCDAALILIDARLGVLAQTRRHALICAVMGIPSVAFVVNKMDLVGNDPAVFQKITDQCAHLVRDLERLQLGFPEWVSFPVSALIGDNLTSVAPAMPWYRGTTVLDWLEARPVYHSRLQALRLPVQYVIKPGLERSRWQATALATYTPENEENFRLYAGRLLAGSVRVGDEVLLLPSGLRSTVRSVVGQLPGSTERPSLGITLHDKLDVSRGEGVFHPSSRPEVSDQFKVRVAWMQDEPLHAGRSYLYQSVYGLVPVKVTKILNRIDLDTYLPLSVDELRKNDLGELELALGKPLPFDEYRENRDTGSFLLLDRLGNGTAAAGTVLHSLRRADNVHWQTTSLSKVTRAHALGQTPKLIWFTGLSGSGKSTIADLLEKELARLGRHTMLLDGDNLRHGLNKDLGFTEADRIENIRRVGEVGRLMVDAGLIVIACFISPYREDRRLVRSLFGPGEFVEVFVDTPVEECERRDVKGLYKKARAGQIPNFTGVNAPYEVPEAPEVHLQTTGKTAEACTAEFAAWLREYS